MKILLDKFADGSYDVHVANQYDMIEKYYSVTGLKNFGQAYNVIDRLVNGMLIGEVDSIETIEYGLGEKRENY